MNRYGIVAILALGMLCLVNCSNIYYNGHGLTIKFPIQTGQLHLNMNQTITVCGDAWPSLQSQICPEYLNSINQNQQGKRSKLIPGQNYSKKFTFFLNDR